jgi:hypothetical protein
LGPPDNTNARPQCHRWEQKVEAEGDGASAADGSDQMKDNAATVYKRGQNLFVSTEMGNLGSLESI